MTGPTGIPSGPTRWWQIPGAAIKMIVVLFLALLGMAADAVRKAIHKEK